MKQRTVSGYVIFLSLVAALGGILFGYDTAVISGTTGKTLEEIEAWWKKSK